MVYYLWRKEVIPHMYTHPGEEEKADRESAPLLVGQFLYLILELNHPFDVKQMCDLCTLRPLTSNQFYISLR